MPTNGVLLATASQLMLAFAERTGLTSGLPARRYLWTDAFAVSNFLGLARATHERRYTDLALRLVDQVHHVLGRYRPDDSRKGWISGLAEHEGLAHPTRGGLRIGKTLRERAPGEPFDDRLEWDRDGQYFHYLTRWMHALDLASRAAKEPRFNLWARELADAAHEAFAYGPEGHGNRRMFWKMSTDLSRPLVPSMGHHDPLDGFVTCIELQATAAVLPSPSSGPDLKSATDDFRAMLEERELSTGDPLGLGGLLTDASRVARLTAVGRLAGDHLLDLLLAATLEGLYDYAGRREWEQPAARRLAFRELGLAIGLRAPELIERITDTVPSRFAASSRIRSRLDALSRYTVVGSEIESFWLDPEHRRGRTWDEHRDINEVMLATCLVPEGYLVIPDVD